MRIGLESCAYFGLYDYDEGFQKLKSHGYSCIDYAELCKRHSDLYTFSQDKYRAFLTDIGESADKHGVEITQLHGLWATDDKTRAQREESIAYFMKEIEGAHYMGCKNVVVHPFLPFGWGAEIDKDPTITVKGGSEACWLFVILPHKSSNIAAKTDMIPTDITPMDMIPTMAVITTVITSNYNKIKAFCL